MSESFNDCRNRNAGNRKISPGAATWLKYIESSHSCHELRALYNRSFAIISHPEVHNRFFERIYFLQQRSASKILIADLDALREDIEDEMETGELRQQNLIILKEAALLEDLPTIAPDLDYLTKNDFLRDEKLEGATDLWAKVERELYIKVLSIHEGNRTKTSAALGVSIRTLRNKLNDWHKETEAGSIPGFQIAQTDGPQEIQ